MKKQYAVFKYCGDGIEQETHMNTLQNAIRSYDICRKMYPDELGYRIMKELTIDEIDKNRNNCIHAIKFVSDIDGNTYCNDCNEVLTSITINTCPECNGEKYTDIYRGPDLGYKCEKCNGLGKVKELK